MCQTTAWKPRPTFYRVLHWTPAGSQQPPGGWLFSTWIWIQERKKKKRKIGVCFVYPGLYQGVPPSMVPQAHSCAVTAGCRRHCRCGFSGGQMSTVIVWGWFFFSFFLCIESAFRKLALHFLHPEVINYLY